MDRSERSGTWRSLLRDRTVRSVWMDGTPEITRVSTVSRNVCEEENVPYKERKVKRMN